MNAKNEQGCRIPLKRKITVTRVGKDNVVRENGVAVEKRLLFEDSLVFEVDKAAFGDAEIEEFRFYAFPEFKAEDSTRHVLHWHKSGGTSKASAETPIAVAPATKQQGPTIKNVNDFSAANVVLYYGIVLKDSKGQKYWIDPELHVVKEGHPLVC